MNRLFLLVILALFTSLAPNSSQATAQEPDRLLLDGKQQALHTNPLSAWLQQHPQALAGVESRSSANWRGYVATWEVVGDQLLLRRVDVATDLVEDDEGEHEWRMEDIAPKLFPGTGPIVATWYSGTLVVPRGELVNYVHMGYGSDYERYVVLVVREGKVTARRDLDQKQFRDFRKARFAAWKKTPQYKAAVAQLRGSEHGDEWEQADIDDFFSGFYAEQYLSLEPAPKPKAKRKPQPKPAPPPAVEVEPKVEVEVEVEQ